MKRSVFLVLTAFLTLAGVLAHAEEESPPPAAVVPAPVAAPKPPVPAAAPAVVPKPAPVEKQKPAAAPPATPPVGTPESTQSGDLPLARETKTAAEPAVSTNGAAGYVWPVISFAMLIVGFVAGYFWRHHVSRHRLGGMTVRIGTWRGTP